MRYTFKALADNYNVPRGHLYGTLLTGQGFDKKSDILRFEAAPKDAHTAIYVLDFGTHVGVRYVAGWNNVMQEIFLQSFPVNGGTRPDNGRPVDMSGWMLGPRRAFHLKLREDGSGQP